MSGQRDEDLLKIETHIERVRLCERRYRDLPLPTATPADARYPLVYPRDTAVIARAYDRLHESGRLSDDEAAAALMGSALFFLDAQNERGLWGQRYDLDARDRSIYPQEDNTAHAIAILARHVRHERRQGRVSPHEEDALESARRGLEAAAREWRDEDLGLYRSTTSIHESSIERGYTLWTNGAFIEAFRLGAEAARAAGDDALAAWCDEHREALRHDVAKHLIHEGRYLRRLTLERERDMRPDITLLSPSYFGFADLAPDEERRTVEWVERELADPDLGLFRRYPPDREDMGIHLHGGDGPYLSFSNWLAQRHALHGRRERARQILERIVSYATPEGHLPEHVATLEKFKAFLDKEWISGLDHRKEFDPDILLPEVGWETILEEAERMTSAYLDALRSAREADDGIIRLARPHAWAHAETALSLALLEDAEESASPRAAKETRDEEKAGAHG